MSWIKLNQYLELEALATFARSCGDYDRVDEIHDSMDPVWYDLSQEEIDWLNNREKAQPVIKYQDECSAIAHGWRRGPRLMSESQFFFLGRDRWWKYNGESYVPLEDDYAEKLSAFLEKM